MKNRIGRWLGACSYGTLVKARGEWRYGTRKNMGGTEPPKGWKE